MDSLFWSDEQWEEWETRTVTVSVDLLERLAAGVELLTQGARLNQAQRAAWAVPLELCQEILDKERATVAAALSSERLAEVAEGMREGEQDG